METFDTITKENTLKLIRALESGEYRKTKKQICTKKGDGFCCLGVWADVQGAEWEADSHGNLSPEGNDGNTATLKERWAGGLSYTTQATLASLNDRSKTFEPVIKYIREKILPNAK